MNIAQHKNINSKNFIDYSPTITQVSQKNQSVLQIGVVFTMKEWPAIHYTYMMNTE